jgi:biotin-dependent carboxylase-like uncharacterized protein
MRAPIVVEKRILVEKPGPRTTMQDAGRAGWAHLGVPRSGAVDALSRRLANVLVNNDDDAAVLETTLSGPALRFGTECVVAVTGAACAVHIDDEPAAFGTAVLVRAGQLLRIGRATAGLHTYVAAAGGFGAELVLNSRSTDTLSGLGPPPLAAGDRLFTERAINGDPSAAGSFADARLLRFVLDGGRRPVRLLPGHGADWLTKEAEELLYSSEFVVAHASDRIGVRLEGPTLRRSREGEADTEGMVSGAVQLPGDGAPIVLLADHAVTGGYPVVGVVATVDLPLVAQARPGTPLRFVRTSVESARAALAAQEMELLRWRRGRTAPVS